MPTHSAETLRLSSDLVVHAARLVRVARRTGIQDGAGVRILSLLDQLGPSTITALAGADRSSQPSMSGAVASLVDKGWVEKRIHPDDARASLVHVTPAGAAALADVRRAHALAVADRLSTTNHTTSDLATAVAVLRDLLATDATSDRPTEEGTL